MLVFDVLAIGSVAHFQTLLSINQVREFMSFEIQLEDDLNIDGIIHSMHDLVVRMQTNVRLEFLLSHLCKETALRNFCTA